MENLLSFLTSTEIIVVYVVALIAILLCFVVYLIDKNYDKRKQKQNTKELNKLVEQVQEKIEEEYDEPVVKKVAPQEVSFEDIPVMIEPIIDVVPSDRVEQPIVDIIPTPEKIKTMSIEELQEDNQQQDKQQQETVQQEQEQVGQVEEEVNDTQVEEVNQVEELHYTDLELTQEQALDELAKLTERLEEEAKKDEVILEERIKDYEDSQERDAIISMDELLERTREMATFKDYNEETAPISLSEIASRNEEVKESELTKTIDQVSSKPTVIENLEVEELADAKPLSEVYKAEAVRFKSSPVISPIFGIEKKETVESMEFENTANYEKLDAEIKKTNEFLSRIRELQKKLGD